MEKSHLLLSDVVCPQSVSVSSKYKARLSADICYLSRLSLVLVIAPSQLANQGPAPARSQPAHPKGELGSTTPQGAVLVLLSVSRMGDCELATKYLNPRLKDRPATTRAPQHLTVLDRRPQLSDKPDGSLTGSGESGTATRRNHQLRQRRPVQALLKMPVVRPLLTKQKLKQSEEMRRMEP